jgi:choline transport protein
MFPGAHPVTATNMNYTCLAFGAALVLAVVMWIARGRREYKGPVKDF